MTVIISNGKEFENCNNSSLACILIINHNAITHFTKAFCLGINIEAFTTCNNTIYSFGKEGLTIVKTRLIVKPRKIPPSVHLLLVSVIKALSNIG